jgi:hypothetical protein
VSTAAACGACSSGLGAGMASGGSRAGKGGRYGVTGTCLTTNRGRRGPSGWKEHRGGNLTLGGDIREVTLGR